MSPMVQPFWDFLQYGFEGSNTFWLVKQNSRLNIFIEDSWKGTEKTCWYTRRVFFCGSNVDQRWSSHVFLWRVCAREDEIEADSFRTAQRAREVDLQRKWELVSSRTLPRQVKGGTTTDNHMSMVCQSWQICWLSCWTLLYNFSKVTIHLLPVQLTSEQCRLGGLGGWCFLGGSGQSKIAGLMMCWCQLVYRLESMTWKSQQGSERAPANCHPLISKAVLVETSDSSRRLQSWLAISGLRMPKPEKSASQIVETTTTMVQQNAHWIPLEHKAEDSWIISYQTGYSRSIFGQRVSLVQNMICLHRFVLGRSMFVPKDRVFSHASPCGPFQHIVFRRKAYQTNGKVEQCNQFCQGIEDRGFRGFIKTIIYNIF